MAWTFEATERGYANLWKTATLKGGADTTNADRVADKIIAAEQRYRAVQVATGVPWYFIGDLHNRESSCNFAGVLHNGEKIIGTGQVTTLEPPGRGPFSTWEEAAIDALKLKNMHRVQDWSVARMLYQAEVFNGLGYVGKGINSPYVWAGTNHEQRGKYVADHKFDPNADDTQLGVAAVLIRLAQKRPDIHADLYPTEKPQVDSQTSDDVLLKEISGLRADIAALPAAIATAIKGAAAPQADAPAVVPKPEPTVATAPVTATVTTTTPVLDRPGVGIGVLGTLASALLSTLGVTGPMTGEGATTTGQLLPILSAGVAALGATGMFGTWGSAISTVLSAFTQAKAQPKS
jgi:lysozyme family protein